MKQCSIALTIAGSDPSGGAGMQVDLKTFHQFGVYGMGVVSLLTVQNTLNVSAVHIIDSDIVADQINTVLEDIKPHAIKTGALGSASIIKTIAKIFQNKSIPLVVDPVLVSTHKASLLDSDAIPALQNELLSCCYLVTPNVAETEVLTGMRVKTSSDFEKAGRMIQSMGAPNVLIKGGHLIAEPMDMLLLGDNIHCFEHPRIETKNTHGTGCVLSAAITAHLARGIELLPAVSASIEFVARAIRNAPQIGHGNGPINIFASSE